MIIDKSIWEAVEKMPAKPEIIAALRTQPGMEEYANALEQRMRKEADKVSFYLDQFITEHPKMLEMKERAKRLAHVNDPVLIQGDTGTGKELIAHALHGSRLGKFVPINCAGLPEHLIESELFGHKKGAFTDAKEDKMGLFVEAKDGTLFLDEVGELKPDLQAKLLRALQTMQVRPVGSNQLIDINCRFVSATHHDLSTLIRKEGDNPPKFREDLYWRISTFILQTLALSFRWGDIPLIVEELDEEKKIDVEKFCKCINSQQLPGNVRQLQQLVRRFYVLGEMPNI